MVSPAHQRTPRFRTVAPTSVTSSAISAGDPVVIRQQGPGGETTRVVGAGNYARINPTLIGGMAYGRAILHLPGAMPILATERDLSLADCCADVARCSSKALHAQVSSQDAHRGEACLVVGYIALGGVVDDLRDRE